MGGGGGGLDFGILNIREKTNIGQCRAVLFKEVLSIYMCNKS